MKDNAEDIIPGVAELRAQERRNRAHAFAGITRTLCGCEIVLMTPMHRLTLQILRNAFVATTADPLEADVMSFLWLLSPDYSRRLTPLSELRQFLLRRRVKALELGIARSQIREYFVEQLQDLPESAVDDDAPDPSPWVHWAATDASWWMNVHRGFTLEGYFATPYLVLQQLYRGWKVNNPGIRYDEKGNVVYEHPSFINESDRLVGKWHRENRAALAAVHRAQIYRID